MSQAQICFAHVRGDNSNPHSGGFTVAYLLGNDRNARVRNICYGYARCLPTDQFCKAEGRNRAYDRLQNKIIQGSQEQFSVSTRAKTGKGIVNAVINQVKAEILAEQKRYLAMKRKSKKK